MMSDPLLTVTDAAALVGIAPATWRGYVARGYAPQPDEPDTGRAVNRREPRWLTSTVEGYIARRAGQGARTDLNKPTFAEGYQAALADLAAQLNQGGANAAREWIKANQHAPSQ